MSKNISIEEMAKCYNITIDTVEYFEKAGLFKSSISNGSTAPKYSTLDLSKLLEVLYYRCLGFSVDEIKKLVKHKLLGELTYASEFVKIVNLMRDNLGMDSVALDKQFRENISESTVYKDAEVIQYISEKREEVVKKYNEIK
ncbi:hypothetical protein K040078D81_44190 [Blautia hominis]|uniref:HTH merR-type domain-containing protein n=1 Tax=Blautia hominis TaxID=2025493 RepID=A0ABQ0BFS6_9FIRM